MKKQLFLFTIALLLCSCGGKSSSSISSTDTGTDTTPTTVAPSISIGSVGEVGMWSDLAPYLEFAVGDYAKYIPSYNAHNYRVYFQQSGDIIAVQVDCLSIRSTTAADSYTSVLTNNDFQFAGDPEYAYKLVSLTDCLFITYIQYESTFSIVAYYCQVRTTEYPTQIVEALVGKDIPECTADAYYYTYGENARGYVTVSIDCFYEDGSKSLSNWLSKLSKAGYEYTNQSGYYTAYSPDGEVVISFDDYYGDGTCIELSMYSYWPTYDLTITFGFDLPRYSGDYSKWESSYTAIGTTNYVCIYYDGVTPESLSVYGKQLKNVGFTFDQDAYDTNGYYVYYLKDKTVNGVTEPWLQLAYSADYQSLCIAVPYTIITE